MSNKQLTKRFLQTKVRALAARATKLDRLTPELVGIRRQDRPFAPGAEHFAAANKRLTKIQGNVRRRLAVLGRKSPTAPPRMTLIYAAMVERETDRARRAFGMFFEVFSQRGSSFAPALAAHDVIAADCYAASRFKLKVLKPLTYMEHGYSPATMRRGVTLSRLLGERNPFPLIRIPWDRDNPWQSVFLHEVAHNLQADMGLWQSNKDAVTRRLLLNVGDPQTVSVYSRWHKEIFADLCAVLLGGTASVWGMMDFLAHPSPKVMTYKPGGAHPTGYLRAMILAEMLRRLGFESEAAKVRRVWRSLYDPARGHRIPKRLLENMRRTIPHVVDEIAFQPRRNLANHALADAIVFTPDHEKAIRKGAAALVRGVVPSDLPPRFVLSASRHAIGLGASLPQLAAKVTAHLAKTARRAQRREEYPHLIAA